jgi:cell division protein ZapA
MQDRVRRLEQQLGTMRNARSVADGKTQANHAVVADAFNAAAERIEELSKRLNQSLGSSVAIG